MEHTTNDTLILIWGQMRAPNLTGIHFYNNVLNKINADLALCIDTPTTKIYDENNMYYKHAKYIWEVIRKDSDWGPLYDEAQTSLGASDEWKKLLSKTGGGFLSGINDSRSNHNVACVASMWYILWYAFEKFKENGLLDKYKWFIISRSDLMWKIPHFSIDMLQEGHIYLPNTNFIHCGNHPNCYPDKHIIIPGEHIEKIFFNMLQLIISRPNDFLNSFIANGYTPLAITPEMILHWTIKTLHLENTIKYYPCTFYTVREENDPYTWSSGVWYQNLGYYLKYPFEYYLYLSYKDHILTQEDWEKLDWEKESKKAMPDMLKVKSDKQRNQIFKPKKKKNIKPNKLKIKRNSKIPKFSKLNSNSKYRIKKRLS